MVCRRRLGARPVPRRQTREHDDLEIGVPRTRFAEVREALAGFEFVVIGDGKAWPLTEDSLATPSPDLGARAGRRALAGRRHARAVGRRHVDLSARPANTRCTPRASSPVRQTGSRICNPRSSSSSRRRLSARRTSWTSRRCCPHLDGNRRAWLRDALDSGAPRARVARVVATRARGEAGSTGTGLRSRTPRRAAGARRRRGGRAR